MLLLIFLYFLLPFNSLKSAGNFAFWTPSLIFEDYFAAILILIQILKPKSESDKLKTFLMIHSI